MIARCLVALLACLAAPIGSEALAASRIKDIASLQSAAATTS
jgi:flagellar basal body P-ring protein FlgI